MNYSSEEIIQILGYDKSYKTYRDFTMLIHNIRSKKYYKNISVNYKIPEYTAINKRSRKLNETDIYDIRNLRKSGYSYSDIALKYNCSAKNN